MMSRGRTWCAVALAVIASGAAGRVARADSPPAALLAGTPVRGAAVDPVFGYLKLDRLRCKFTEAKHVALLARPLQSSGTIYFDRRQGIARITLAPRRQEAVLTATALRIRDGAHTEVIPLDKTQDLRAFALIFPTLLRGDRGELERAFELELYGSARARWALAFTPKAESLRKLVRRVVVFGDQADVGSIQVAEASGDTTDTQLTEVQKNAAVPDAEIAAAFGPTGPTGPK
jgi:hypothetical protein